MLLPVHPTMSNQGFSVNAVNFDGSSDYLNRGADLTSNADAKTFTASVWIKPGDYANRQIWQTDSDGLEIRLFVSGDNGIQLRAENASGTTILNASENSTDYTASAWHHLLISIDLANASNRYVYFNDAARTMTWTTYTNDTIEFTRSDHGVGALPSGSANFIGDMAELWVDMGNYLDISTEANRRKFIDASGKPVDLGADGSTPTGTAPIAFFSGATASWHTNKGSGGGFTENGALTDASTSPSD